MNELDLIRAFRSDVAEPDEQTRQAVRATIAARARPRHRRRSRWLIVAAAAGVAVLAAVSALAAGPQFSALFDGTPVPVEQLQPADRFVLSSSDARGPRVELLARRDGRAFYIIKRQNGGPCYASGAVGQPLRLGVTMCPRAGASLAFPSSRQPILDQSSYAASATTSDQRLLSLAGFAADPVKRIAVIDDQGVTAYSVPVIDNVYVASDLPTVPVGELVAFDASGHELYRQCMTGDGC
jgi:hypothetical protein